MSEERTELIKKQILERKFEQLKKHYFEFTENLANAESELGIVYFSGHGANENQVEELSETKNSNINVNVNITDLDTENQNYFVEFDEIIDKIHVIDNCIAETRQNTTRLGVETRSMLSDLRKQLG